MGLVHSVPGAYFRCQGCGAAILEGFATIIRVLPRISHQGWRSPCDKLEKSQISKNPDPSRKWDVEPGRGSGRDFHGLCMVPECVAAVPTHCRPVVGQFYVGCAIYFGKFDKNTSKTHKMLA